MSDASFFLFCSLWQISLVSMAVVLNLLRFRASLSKFFLNVVVSLAENHCCAASVYLGAFQLGAAAQPDRGRAMARVCSLASLGFPGFLKEAGEPAHAVTLPRLNLHGIS